jgi:DNA helicase-2/ATP-dependent DNA helicase PcrA
VREGTVEEERRLCYVGMTRAKDRLYITWSTQRHLYGQSMYNAPSRFLWELPGEFLNSPLPEAPRIAGSFIKSSSDDY